MSISVTIIHFLTQFSKWISESNINNNNYDSIQKICQETS